jgi:hypothetical protein
VAGRFEEPVRMLFVKVVPHAPQRHSSVIGASTPPPEAVSIKAPTLVHASEIMSSRDLQRQSSKATYVLVGWKQDVLTAPSAPSSRVHEDGVSQ